MLLIVRPCVPCNFSLGFVEVNYVAAFEEYELQFQVGGLSGSSSAGSAEDEGTARAVVDEAQIERNRQLVLDRGSHAVYAAFAEEANYDD
jgi:hypothetical protein